jgi:hypothetical protein
MLKFKKRSLAALAAVLGLMGASLTLATSAQAYGYLRWEVAYVNVDPDGTCQLHFRSTMSASRVKDWGETCYIGDSADGTYFVKNDRGGTAIKAEAYNSSGKLVAKTEFHPYGEHLYVYDTANDGDTLYTEIEYSDYSGGWKRIGFVAPPASSAPVEYTHKNYSLPEGWRIQLKIYDDRDKTYNRGTFAYGTS